MTEPHPRDRRFYCVWEIPGDPAAAGLWSGPFPQVWAALLQRLPGGQYAGSGARLRRYPSEVFGVNWDSISFGVDDEPIKRIMMAEPLKGSKEHVHDLLERSPTATELVKNLSI